MMVIGTGIHKLLVRIANGISCQTASLSHLSRPFWQAASVPNFKIFTVVILSCIGEAD